MEKEYPCIEIDLDKITHNSKVITDLCREKGIHVAGVTKVFCAQIPIVKAMLAGGIELIGDSRLENLEKMRDLNCRKMLLRIPMESHAEQVIKYSDISLNSELDTIKCLSAAAKKLSKVHCVILMVDVGDLREGILENDVIGTITEIIKLDNIKLSGIGTNLTCYGGVIPDSDNLGRLVEIKNEVKKELNIELPIISGGNSSSLYAVIDGTIPKGINQLRIGEAIVLGRETSFGNQIEGCHNDNFILQGEIIEIKNKPSIPKGRIGMDAFGQTPHFQDKGVLRRAIVALGRQDITVEGLMPLDERLNILGASSDHLILDITNCIKQYKVGDMVEFNMDYGCLLRAMTSPYVRKYYKTHETENHLKGILYKEITSSNNINA